jgi:hypothetical protein
VATVRPVFGTREITVEVGVYRARYMGARVLAFAPCCVVQLEPTIYDSDVGIAEMQR